MPDVAPRKTVAKPLVNTSNAASRNRARRTWAIAPPSTCLSQAAGKLISTKFAATTCSIFCMTCGLGHRERPAPNRRVNRVQLFPQDDGFPERPRYRQARREGGLGAKKDWPVNVDKRNKNKKYATYTEQEVAAMLQRRGQRRGSSHPLSRWDRLPHRRSCGLRSGWTSIGRTRPSRFASSRSSVSSPKTMKSGPSRSATRCSLASRSIVATRRMMH